MSQEVGTIYVATNLVNGKQYVGQTTITLKERWYQHKNGTNCPLIHRAIQKYGMEKFKIISFPCLEEDLDWTEGFLQKEFNTIAPNGYNLILNEAQHRRHNESSKEKMKKNHADFSGKNHPQYGLRGEKSVNFGRVFSQEEKEKVKEGLLKYFQKFPQAHKGKNNPMFNKEHRLDTKEKMKLSKIGKYFGKNNPNFGHKWTQEQKDAQSNKMKLIKQKRQNEHISETE
jgi:group I intron endonuclease